LNGAARRRSKSTGSALHGSRIAQVIAFLVFLNKSFGSYYPVVCPYSFASIICSRQGRTGPTVSVS
jgi:hypothetical protein